MQKSIRLISLALCICVLAVMVAVAIPFYASAADPWASLDQSYTLYQMGNQLVNQKGQSVRLLGTNVPQLGWSATGDNIVEKILDLSLGEWQSNVIRLAVKPHFWLQGAYQLNADGELVLDAGGNPIQTVTKEAYRALVDKMVDKVTKQGKYVLLDNHSFYLPGEDSEQFWASAAAHYKNHPNVIFGLFNEPTACTWDEWLRGGTITFNGTTEWGTVENITVTSKGMRNLLKIVRDTGANNVVTISGLTWGYDLTYVTTTHRIEDTPSGNGIIYETHPYPDRDPDYDACFGVAAREYPVLVGECGPKKEHLNDLNDAVYMKKLLEYFDKYELHLAAWAMGAWPNLIVNGKNTPTNYGAMIKDYIIKNQAERSVTLYEGVDFKGKALSVTPGYYTADDLKKLGFDIDKLGSVNSKYNAYQYAFSFFRSTDAKDKPYVLMSATRNFAALKIGFKPKLVYILRHNPQNLLRGNSEISVVNGNADGIQRLTDGKTNENWLSVSDGRPQTVIIQLKKPMLLSSIELYHAGEAGELEAFNTKEFTVSLSTNGILYTRVADVQNNTMSITEHRFEPVSAKYIKISLRAGSLIEPERVALTEIAAYGAEYTGTIPPLPARLANPASSAVQTASEAASSEAVSEEPVSSEASSEAESTVSEISSDTESEAASDVGNTPEKGGGPLVIILSVAGAVLILGGGAAVCFFRMRKKAK